MQIFHEQSSFYMHCSSLCALSLKNADFSAIYLEVFKVEKLRILDVLIFIQMIQNETSDDLGRYTKMGYRLDPNSAARNIRNERDC